MKLKLLLSFMLFVTAIVRAQSITELGFFSPLISTFDMKYTNNHLVIAQQNLKIFDVTNPANPTQVGTATIPGTIANQLAVKGNYAYCGEGANGVFTIFDIANFNSPTMVGSITIPSSAFITGGELIIHNNNGYMSGVDSLYVIDVTNPAAPVLDTTFQVVNIPFGTASSLSVNGMSLFVLHSLGIAVYDITNPLIPALIHTISFTHPYYSNGLAVDTIGNRLFCPWLNTLQADLGYDAYDITNSGSPVFLFTDSVPFGGGEFGVTDYYNNLLVISKGGGVNMFDVSSNHHFLTSFTGQNVPNSTVSIEFRDSVFYNARRGGFEILRYNGGFPTLLLENKIGEDNGVIYPNPFSTSTTLTFNLEKSETVKINIYDITGRNVNTFFTGTLASGIQQIKIDATGYAKGIYLCELKTSLKLFTQKLIIQ
ncbi:MAG: T9SS type A sorting domain-containing protein [Bacteroidia bacterium]